MLFFKRRQSCIADKATGKKLWYPQTVINGSTASTLHIAEQISELSGASRGDVFGILRDLGIVMRRELASGKRIKLDGIGSFRIIAQAKGSGVEKKEDVKASQFNSVRVNFRAECRYNTVTRERDCTLIAPDLKFAEYGKPVPTGASSNAGGTDTGGDSPQTGGGEQGSGGGGL